MGNTAVTVSGEDDGEEEDGEEEKDGDERIEKSRQPGCKH